MALESIIGLINLFFVPMLPVSLYYKKDGRPLAPSLGLLLRYAVSAVLLIPLAKTIIFLPGELILHRTVSLDSSYYTLAALIAAWLLPPLLRLAESVPIKARLKKNKKSSGNGDLPDGAAR